jgi:hypothetical protein
VADGGDRVTRQNQLHSGEGKEWSERRSLERKPRRWLHLPLVPNRNHADTLGTDEMTAV